MLKVYQTRKEGAEKQVRLGYSTAKASHDPTGSSEAGMALKVALWWGKGARSLMD